jgi:PadR family transcriptional regulator AphA
LLFAENKEVAAVSLRHAILVLLDDREASGYDLAGEFSQGIGHVWNATHQQIYLELGRMTSDGFVEFRHVPQAGKPDKKLYHITEAGYAELRTWMDEPAPQPRLRDALMIKIAGGHLADSERLLAELHEQMDAHREVMATFRSMESAYKQLSSEQREKKLFQWLALRRGLLTEQAWFDWAMEVEAVLQERVEKQRREGDTGEQAQA